MICLLITGVSLQVVFEEDMALTLPDRLLANQSQSSSHIEIHGTHLHQVFLDHDPIEGHGKDSCWVSRSRSCA